MESQQLSNYPPISQKAAYSIVLIILGTTNAQINEKFHIVGTFSQRGFFPLFFRAVPEGIFNISQGERKNVCWTDQKEKEEDLSSISSCCPPEGIQARR